MPNPPRDHVVRIVQRYYALVDREDIDALVGLFAAEAVYLRPGYDPLVGRDQLTRFYREDRVIASGRHTIERVVVEANRAAVEGCFTGRLKNGQDAELRFADHFRLDDALLISRRTTYFFTPLV